MISYIIFILILFVLLYFYFYKKEIIKEEIKIPENIKVPENIKIPELSMVYLTISIEEQFKDPTFGKIIIKLYDNTPRTSNNFLELCKRKMYINTKFHRIIKNFMIQSGDYDGFGGMSIYNELFEDENFLNKHNKPGLLSMANSGPNTNGSQFFITTTETPHLDNKHVVFGEVISGMDYVYNLENQITNHKDEPLKNCYISDCGLI